MHQGGLLQAFMFQVTRCVLEAQLEVIPSLRQCDDKAKFMNHGVGFTC